MCQIVVEAGGSYAPGCYIIRNLETDEDLLVQSDYDFPGLAMKLGWTPCDCLNGSATDGTVDCACGRTATSMIASAAEFLDDHLDEPFDDPGYFDD
jgi:hypothetical protein